MKKLYDATVKSKGFLRRSLKTPLVSDPKALQKPARFFCRSVLFLLLFVFILPIYSVPPRLNYNYEYSMEDSKTKFSEWVPYKLHKWNPKFLEDYYELYGLKLHYNEEDLRRDINFLKIGLKSRFRHPKNALCHVHSEDEYYKYRLLLTMHLNLQLMRSYMRIASLYDKRHVDFYNLDYAHELKKSFETAIAVYNQAKPYWKEAKDNALKANKILKEIDLGTIESERFEIVNGKLNFENIINDHIAQAEKKLQIVKEYLAKNPDADKPVLEQGD